MGSNTGLHCFDLKQHIIILEKVIVIIYTIYIINIFTNLSKHLLC